jgi:hypothetical protein
VIIMPLYKRNRPGAATASPGGSAGLTCADHVHRLEERHYTVPELAEMWNLSRDYVRQVVSGEPGVTEWVRQQPGRRRYRVLRVPRSVAERVYMRAVTKAEAEPR